MKYISIILAALLLSSCAGMRGMNNTGSTNQMDINRHDSPNDIYFGG